MIGLTGSHRTGKTTLARAYSERAGIKLLQTDVKGTFVRLGADPKAEYSFVERLILQHEILKDARAVYEKGGVRWITDRTPLCMLAYTLADIQRTTLNYGEAEKLVQDYFDACVKVCNEHFTTLVVVQPGIQPTDHALSAPTSAGFMQHMTTLVLGLTVDARVTAHHFYIPRAMTSLESRIEAVQYAVNRSSERYRNVRDAEIAEGRRSPYTN